MVIREVDKYLARIKEEGLEKGREEGLEKDERAAASAGGELSVARPSGLAASR